MYLLSIMKRCGGEFMLEETEREREIEKNKIEIENRIELNTSGTGKREKEEIFRSSEMRSQDRLHSIRGHDIFLSPKRSSSSAMSCYSMYVSPHNIIIDGSMSFHINKLLFAYIHSFGKFQ